jgi:hypothetical protein
MGNQSLKGLTDTSRVGAFQIYMYIWSTSTTAEVSQDDLDYSAHTPMFRRVPYFDSQAANGRVHDSPH